MTQDLFRSAREGFFGSFRLAAMMIIAVVAVVAGFINGNGDEDADARHGPHSHFQ